MTGICENKRLKLSNVFLIMALIACLNFWVAAFGGLYDRFGWNAPLAIGLDSMVIGLLLSIVSVVLKVRNAAAWLAFAVNFVSVALFFAFAFSFKFKM